MRQGEHFIIITGVQCQEKLNLEMVMLEGFSWIEITYEQLDSIWKAVNLFPMSGMTVKVTDILQNRFEVILELSTELMLSYLVIDTRPDITNYMQTVVSDLSVR